MRTTDRPNRLRGAARAALALAATLALVPSATAGGLIRAVAAGGDTTCTILAGMALCWGSNTNGQVGNNTTVAALEPKQVVGFDRFNVGVTSIATSGFHSCLVARGGAWCWGDNAYGQLGNNTLVDSPVPVPVTGLSSGVTAIATGDLHTCAVVNGGVKCWGNGGFGQLGNGATPVSSPVPVDVALLGSGSGVTRVTAGTNHSCAIATGFAYCWGRGDSGEIGGGSSTFINPGMTNVTGFGGTFANIATEIDGGGAFTCGVKDGAAYCWGFGSNGQLGNGFASNSATPLAVSTLGSGVTSIAAGTGLHGCAVASGAAKCWGFNNAGQLGNPAFGGGSNVPVQVQGLASDMVQVATGGLHSCAIGSEGLHCWGDNPHGQLGTAGTTPSNVPVRIIDFLTATAIVASPPSLAFGGQSIGTTSAPQALTLTNTGSTSVSFTEQIPSDIFAWEGDCATLAPGASCTLAVRFTPLRATTETGLVSLNWGPEQRWVVVEATGTGERSLVTHYYGAILQRAPDAGGKAFWESEAVRVAALGANVNETWFAMAQGFYGSAEYAALGRNDTGFVTDLYNTFFNRVPDGAGLAFWTGQLASGLPREVALVSFMFSAEFVGFTQGIFGNTAVRAEIDTVVDFYRGLLARLPDDDGFNFWRQRFRTAQCSGAAAVTAQVEAISSAFALSGEYAARARTNAQYVGDLYNAFLRRGGDLGGVQFWIGQLASGAMTREELRRTFIGSPEFQGRVQAIIAQGCLP